MHPITLSSIALHRVQLPLHTPYRLSYRVFEEFEPIIAVIHDDDGRCGFGEGHIAPGSSQETRAQGWAFCRHQAKQMPGLTATAAGRLLSADRLHSPVAASALLSALDMLTEHPLLTVPETVRLPLLTPFNALTEEAIVEEVEQRLEQGFRTFKIKVGKDVQADLRRVALIQRASGGRATLRIDANRAYSRQDGCLFARSLEPAGIELFEQPCASEDWAANAAVARVSAVPLMLDEPICSLADIERAATLTGVGFCKLKLKRFGSLQGLHTALQRVRALGMEPVLGDGLASEIGCWMEACVARSTITNAGEFNGYLKSKIHLFEHPLAFSAGELILPCGRPALNEQRLAEHTLEVVRFEL